MAVRDSIRKKGHGSGDKPHLNLVVIGHVDHGKSSLVGRLLLETGYIDSHLIEKYKKEAAEKGKATFELAWVMDALKEERERGLTIDVSYMRLDTSRYYITIIDAPGHQDFIKNMITGTSQADAALLVVAATEGIKPQTKEHSFLAKALGIDQMVVAINKMDGLKNQYDREYYYSLETELKTLLQQAGFKMDNVQFIPVSALCGDNVTKKSANLSWFKGPTLLDALETFSAPELPTNLPLRIPVEQIYSITGVGTVPIGRVECGMLKPGDKVIFQPSGKTGEVRSIQMHREPLHEAYPGHNIGFNVRGISKNDVKRGNVAGPIDNPPQVPKTFVAQIAILQHPGTISAGYTPVFHCHTATVACTFEKLLKKVDPRTGKVLEENPSFLKKGDIGVVQVRPIRPLVIEKFREIPQLGRFAVRDLGMTIAAGICLEVNKR